jgi:branched-chain amino acid transport system substrate-binding protein
MTCRRLFTCGGALALACASIAFGGCGKSDDNGGSGGVKGGTVRFGAALSLTGSLAREGVLTKQGYQLCQDKVNAQGGIKAGDKTYKLNIRYQDDKSQPDTAAQLVDRFNDQGIKFILGPYGSASTEAASAVVERNKQVMADSAGADNNIFTKGYKQTFAVLSPATEYTGALVKAVAELNPKPKTVAILTADDGFSKTAAEGGRDEAKKQGMEVVAFEEFPEHATDVSSALTKVRGKNPDLILGSVHVEEGVAIVKQSSELGLKPKGIAETVAPPTPDFVKALGPRAEGVLGSTQWTTAVKGQDKFFGTAKDYARDFEAKFGGTPEYHSAEAAGACLAMVLGIEKAGSTEPEKVREAMAGLDEESFFGRIKFDDTGKNIYKPMSVIQIQGGKAVTVWPSDQSEGEVKWPANG